MRIVLLLFIIICILFNSSVRVKKRKHRQSFSQIVQVLHDNVIKNVAKKGDHKNIDDAKVLSKRNVDNDNVAVLKDDNGKVNKKVDNDEVNKNRNNDRKFIKPCGVKNINHTNRVMCFLDKNCKWHYEEKKASIGMKDWENMTHLIHDVRNLSTHSISLIKYDNLLLSLKNNKFVSSSKVLKNMLCTVFTAGDQTSMAIINKNMELLENVDWAIILYKNITLNRNHFYKNASVVKIAIYRHIEMGGFIPKPLLYQEIMDIISNYRWVWLLDSDISAEGFKFQRFLELLEWTQTSLNGPPPLIMHPLGANTSYRSYRKYLVERTWKKNDFIDAAYVNFIEQDFPVMNATFFEWLVINLIKPFNPIIKSLQTDWGFDTHWCRIARDYQVWSNGVKSYDNDVYPCAVVLGSTPILHKDTKLIVGESSDLGLSFSGNWRFCMKGTMIISEILKIIHIKNATKTNFNEGPIKLIAPAFKSNSTAVGSSFFPIDRLTDILEIYKRCKYGFYFEGDSRNNRDEYYWDLISKYVSKGSELGPSLRMSIAAPNMSSRKTEWSRKLLCVVILAQKIDAIRTLKYNILSSKKNCDWAILFTHKVNVNEVRALLPTLSDEIVYIDSVNKTNGRTVKPVFFAMVVDIAHKYERVWLLDSDIDLQKFSFEKLFSLLDGDGFKQYISPLISQPVIEGSGKYYKFVNYDFWYRYKGIAAIRHTFTEIQIPIFDSRFFIWFVSNIMKPLIPIAEEFQSDWVWDRFWCQAAMLYSNNSIPCAILVDENPVVHLDTKSAGESDLLEACIRGETLTYTFGTLFPHWLGNVTHYNGLIWPNMTDKSRFVYRDRSNKGRR